MTTDDAAEEAENGGSRRLQATGGAKNLLEAVVEAMPNAVLLVDPQGAIELANTRAARLFGYAPEQLQGQLIERLLPERYRAGHRGMLAAFMRSPGTREMGAGRDLFGLRRDGSELPIEVGLDVLRFGGQVMVLASVFDASSRQAARREADAATALAQSIVDCAYFPIIATDLQGMALEVSPSAERLLRCRKQDLLGRPVPVQVCDSSDPALREIVLLDPHEALEPQDYSSFAGKVSCGETDARDWTLVTRDGARIPVQLAISGLRSAGGELSGYIATLYDLSERKQFEARIRHVAEHDALTGLPNRTLLYDRLKIALLRAQRARNRVGVLMIDLDHFKRVNDSLGHHIGDKLLIGVADRLRGSLRESDTVARMGGDEFVVVLPDLKDKAEAAKVSAKILDSLSIPQLVEQHQLEMTLSIGVCVYPDDALTTDDLIRNADTAMYAAKESGRGRFVAFSGEMADAASERWAIEQAIREALEAGDFRVQYQPQLNLQSGRVTGAEALLRWSHRTRGSLSPGRFIPIAEQSGLIVPLGDWVLRTACKEIGALRGSLAENFRLAVNLSPRQLRQPNIVELVEDALASARLPAAMLELELTESMLLDDEVLDAVKQLRGLGVRIAIDDFGTGYSSLSHVTRFPIDRLKIDRSFVQGITDDSSQAAVTAAIIAMASQLGIGVTAEGVETSEQRHALQKQGCHEAQGFLFSPSVPVDQLPAAVARIETTAGGV